MGYGSLHKRQTRPIQLLHIRHSSQEAVSGPPLAKTHGHVLALDLIMSRRQFRMPTGVDCLAPHMGRRSLL